MIRKLIVFCLIGFFSIFLSGITQLQNALVEEKKKTKQNFWIGSSNGDHSVVHQNYWPKWYEEKKFVETVEKSDASIGASRSGQSRRFSKMIKYSAVCSKVSKKELSEELTMMGKTENRTTTGLRVKRVSTAEQPERYV